MLFLQSKKEFAMNDHSLESLRQNGYCVLTLTGVAHLATLSPELARCSIVGLCTAGSMSCELNMERVGIKAGERICISHLLQVRVLECSADLCLHLLVMSHDFIFNCTQGINAEAVQNLFISPATAVSDERFADMLKMMLDVMQTHSAVAPELHNLQVSMAIARSIIMVLIQLDESRETMPPLPPFSSTDRYFRRFMSLVSENVRTEHEVTFYATQLSITPKYLSEICKAKTGRKAKEIISALLLRAIKTDLIISGMTMKELAARYGFANQSSMGKFFRKMTGLSPLHFRQFENSK